ncbi:hypothetical protein Syun_012762 [Stephania yunnanensis]|uniref:Uncharacterized protein n=1 Tax=Stephania yunnanensis TaxID=152371 RepID=A0AAP0PGP5_9MAGN
MERWQNARTPASARDSGVDGVKIGSKSGYIWLNMTRKLVPFGHYDDVDAVATIIIGTDTNACYAERIDAIIKCQGLLMNFRGMIDEQLVRPLTSLTVEIKSLLKPIISVEEVPGYSIRCPILHVDECTSVLICWCLCVAALAPPSYYLFFLLSFLPHSGIPPFNHDHEGPSNDIPCSNRRTLCMTTPPPIAVTPVTYTNFLSNYYMVLR